MFHIIRNSLPILSVFLILSGCKSTEPANTLDVANTAEQTAPIIQGSCPRVSFREGTTYYRAYTRKGEGDPSKITYQSSLADATRSCTISGGQLNVSVFAAGRLLAGPQGKAGEVQLPIRVVVVDKKTKSVLYSELSTQVVSLIGPNLTAQFVFNDPNVIIPAGAGGETEVFIGFDSGPKS
ncbi:hypothetical protein [Lentilitoribacter sp. EG35]|uniref:hypothetical protein n=1 Tax=Lentilitoribacter sp. EG35 TaxID=3234192 RepID=UPI0034613878